MTKPIFATAIGMVSIIIGLIALSAGMFEYPIWKHNDEVLRWNELMGHVSSEDRRVVMLQFILTFGGIILGIIFILIGLYLLWDSPIDRLTDRLHQMFSSQQKSWGDKGAYILIIIGIIAIAFGIFEYTVWQRNSQTLAWKRHLGYVSLEDIKLVEFQFRMMLGGFIVGIILVVVGLFYLRQAIADRLDYLIHTRKQSRLQIPEEHCPKCGKSINDNWVRCPICLSPLKIVCSNCKRKINISWSACPYCGTILEDVKKV